MVRILLPAIKDGKHRRFVQFCLVGLSGVVVNMGVFWFFTRIVGLSEPYDLVALILGIIASIFSNFVLNDIWTFRDRKDGRHKICIVACPQVQPCKCGCSGSLLRDIHTPYPVYRNI